MTDKDSYGFFSLRSVQIGTIFRKTLQIILRDRIDQQSAK